MPLLPMFFGGWTSEQVADEDTQAICDKVRKALEERYGRKFSSYIAKRFILRVTDTFNYVVKIEVDSGAYYLHVSILSKGEPYLDDSQDHHTADDPVEPL